MNRNEFDDDYKVRNPTITELDTNPHLSEHEVSGNVMDPCRRQLLIGIPGENGI